MSQSNLGSDRSMLDVAGNQKQQSAKQSDVDIGSMSHLEPENVEAAELAQNESTRKSSRVSKPSLKARETKASEILQLLKDAMKTQIQTQKIHKEALQTSSTFSELNQIHNSLESSLEPINALYNELKTLAEHIEPTLENKIQNINRDNMMLRNQAYDLMSKLSTRNKEPEANADSGEYMSVISRSSRSSRVSSASSVLRLKRSEAIANARAKRAELEAQNQQEKLEEELKELMKAKDTEIQKKKSEIQKHQLRAELEVEEIRAEVFQQALEEEDEVYRSTEETVISSKPQNDKNVIRLSNTTKQIQNKEVKQHISKPLEDNLNASVTNQSRVSLPQEAIYNKLPTPEPAKYDGDPLSFSDWWVSFSIFIDSKPIPNIEKLFYLNRYVEGKAKQAISGYFMTGTDEAYQRAKTTLKERFGDPHVISKAFREKIQKWPKISSKNREGIRDFADFLQHLVTASRALPELKRFDDSEEINKMLQRLPEELSRRWSLKVVDTKEEKGRLPTLSEFSRYVEREAKAMNEPSLFISTIEHQTEPQKRAKTHKTQQEEITVPQGDVMQECILCEMNNHSTAEVGRLQKKPTDERNAFVRKNGLCFACLLKAGHISKDCPKRAKCKICSKNHPTALHADKTEEKNHPTKLHADTTEESPTNIGATTHRTSSNEHLSVAQNKTSMTLPVWIHHVSDPAREILVYAMMDTQSDTSFITEKTAREIDVKGKPISLSITTLTSTQTKQALKFDGFKVRGYSSHEFVDLPSVYTRDAIPAERSHIPTQETAQRWPHLQGISGKLPKLLNCEVGLLLGYDCSELFVPKETVTGKTNDPFALRTILGWSIIGGMSTPSQAPTSKCHHTLLKEDVKPQDILKALEPDFYVTDVSPDMMSQEDLLYLDIMKKSIRKCGQKYEMPLPFKKGKPPLKNNRAMAVNRFESLVKKFGKNEQYKTDYMQFMNEMIARGDAEEIPTNAREPIHGWYLPHFGVYHPKKQKLRVVFDGSAKFKGESLNEELLTGPDMMNSLIGILLRFRQESIAVAGDIEKMFHQFKVREEDRDFLRFIWFDGDGEVVNYRMTVHLFGAASSPGCATFALRKIADDHSDISTDAATFIKRNFYVDDGLTSLDNEEDAIKLVENARKICEQGGLRLHKFVSNSQKVIDSIPESERETRVRTLAIHQDNSPKERVLGLQWNILKDTFEYSSPEQSKDDCLPHTRREILSTVAKIYDPLGFVGPFLLKGKQILQELCKLGKKWKEPLDTDIMEQWRHWLQGLSDIDKLAINRCIKPPSFGVVKHVELHHFSDASFIGYGACSYIRLISNTDEVHCSLLLSKSRVVPIKATTIPRLELQAAVVATKLSMLLRKELDVKINEEHFWTDSQTVLGYIANDSKRFHVYVCNRVQAIRNVSNPSQWHYVNTKDNPADIASRGVANPKLLNNPLWNHGPSYLHESNWHPEKDPVEMGVYDGDPEVKAVTRSTTSVEQKRTMTQRLNKFSDWNRAVTAIAKLKRAMQTKSWKVGRLEPPDRVQGATQILKWLQAEHFAPEILRLANGQQVSKRSCIRALCPFTDADGLLRVGGRLNNSHLSFDEKHPIIIPKKTEVGNLLIRYHHNNSLHQGKLFTQSALRKAGLWIVGGSSAIGRVIKLCVNCRKLRQPCEEQLMSDLPMERTEVAAPFTHIGVDCFGPFKVKDGRRESKRYGAIFSCLASRAVHLELINDMTTDSFLMALRRLIAIRGNVQTVRSDQGTNIVGAANELARALKEIKDMTLRDSLSSTNIEFITNPPNASHFGGVWERQIRTVRNVLNGILQKHGQRLDTSTLHTMFYETSAIINNTPLTTDDLYDPLEPVITPNHILTMKPAPIAEPPGQFDDREIYGRKCWRQAQQLAQEFWEKWKTHYRQNMQKRQKWCKENQNLEAGDIVMVKDESLKRNDWSLAMVEHTKPGNDGLVRSVRLRMSNRNLNSKGKPTVKTSYLERPIHKLVMILPANKKAQAHKTTCSNI